MVKCMLATYVKYWYHTRTDYFMYFFLSLVESADTRAGDFITQEDTIFISGMSPRTTEGEIKQHFGAIGIIKVWVPYVCVVMVDETVNLLVILAKLVYSLFGGASSIYG